MEATADRIRSVVKNLLPERPHHLSLYPDRKYPVPQNFWRQQHTSLLQYSTFISDADRGVLLTRPYFDICDEPDPTPASAQSTARTGPKKTLNKMSFKQYKEQREKASISPTENGIPVKSEEKSATLKDALRKDNNSTKVYRDSGSQQDSKAQETRVNGEIERYALKQSAGKVVASSTVCADTANRSKNYLSASKSSSRDAHSPSDSKKRALDVEEHSRPQKKSRSGESLELPRKLTRPETPRRREQQSNAHDRSTGKESKGLQMTPSGRATSATGIHKDGHRATSPKGTVQTSKSQGLPNTLPRRPEPPPGKPRMPPLLSPLRHPAFDDELEPNSPKKRIRDSPSGGRVSSKEKDKSTRSDGAVRKQKSFLPELPALLSPTLPALVEDELQRLEEDELLATKGSSNELPDVAKAARKPQARSNAEEELRKPKTLMVTLKIKKSIRGTVRRLLALPSKSKKERSASIENTPPPAKKRPRPADASHDSAPLIPSKRPKVAEPSASKVPYTPLNQPVTGGSHGLSGSSQTQTPRVAATPMSADTNPPPSRGSSLSKESLLRRHGAMMSLGKTLKRERDKERIEQEKEKQHIHQNRPNGATISVNGLGGHVLRPVLLTMEMILAYYIAFRSGDQAAEISRTHVDVQNWLSLEAHLKELRRMTHQFPPLFTLATQLNGILTNEIMRGFATMKMDENAIKHCQRNMSGHLQVWAETDYLRTKLSDDKLKTEVMGPWTSVYKAATEALILMDRIAERERVSWRAELTPPKDP